MIELVKKDILFNFKYFILSLVMIFMPIVFEPLLPSENLKLSLLFVLPFLVVSLFISKVCYTEDDTSTKAFLKTLPIQRRDVVLSKYLDASILIFITVTFNIIYSGITHVELPLSLMVLSICCLYIYTAIYLTLFELKNYHFAQNAIVFTFILMLIVAAIINYTNFNFSLNGAIKWQILLLVSSMTIIFCSILIAISIKKKK